MIIGPCNRKFLVFTNGGNNFPRGDWIFISLTCAIKWVGFIAKQNGVSWFHVGRIILRKSILQPWSLFLSLSLSLSCVSRARKITNSIHLNYRCFNQDPSHSYPRSESLIEVQFRTSSNLSQFLSRLSQLPSRSNIFILNPGRYLIKFRWKENPNRRAR